MKIFWFMTFRTKLWSVQNVCVLCSIKYYALLEFMSFIIKNIIRVYDGTRYLVLFGSEKKNIYSMIRYLIS